MSNTNALPLSGVKVLELATVVAVPMAGRLLATYGAEVIKIETPPDGDLLRPMGRGHHMHIDDENEPLFDMVNAGKKVTAVNLKTQQGREVFFRLLSQSDVLLSNVRMRSLQKMGLDYQTLHARFPGLIYAHFSGFGLQGPDSELPGFDSTAFWVRSGAANGWGTPDSYPIRPSFGFGDICSASMLLNGVLIALYARQNGGEGTFVGTSLYGCGIWGNSTSVLNSQPQFGKQYPLDRYQAWDPFSDCYRCADGRWIAMMEVSYVRDKVFFAKLFDMPELVNDPDCADLKTLSESGRIPEIVKKVEQHMLAHTSEEWARLLDENNVPNQILRNFSEVSQDEQAWANGYLQKADYPDRPGVAMPMPPLTFSAYGQNAFVPGCPLARDTAEVLDEAGYTPEQVQSLRSEGAVL